MDNRISIVYEQRNIVGESPLWDERDNSLYWADLLGKRIFCHRPASGTTRQWQLSENIGSLALTPSKDVLLVAIRSGVYFFDTRTEELSHLVTPEGEPREMNRFNDGKVAPDGSFFVGTMDENFKELKGRLYRIDRKGNAKRVKEGFMVSNGLAWDESGTTMYHSCSELGKIWAYDFDPDTADFRNERLFATLERSRDGGPDGAACSVDGCYWSAGVFGGKIHRYDPRGHLVEQIALPSKGPTMVCFGGKDGSTLFVTSLTEKLTQKDFDDYPHSGYVLAVQTDTTGVSIPFYDCEELP